MEAGIKDWNLKKQVQCSMCKTSIAERRCGDCIQHQMICKLCFTEEHQHGHRRVHEYHNLVCFPAESEGEMESTVKKPTSSKRPVEFSVVSVDDSKSANSGRAKNSISVTSMEESKLPDEFESRLIEHGNQAIPLDATASAESLKGMGMKKRSSLRNKSSPRAAGTSFYASINSADSDRPSKQVRFSTIE